MGLPGSVTFSEEEISLLSLTLAVAGNNKIYKYFKQEHFKRLEINHGEIGCSFLSFQKPERVKAKGNRWGEYRSKIQRKLIQLRARFRSFNKDCD